MSTAVTLEKNPLLKPGSIFVVALSLSIGWGIRGNFGHESGAWIPGALSAIAVCLMSGREDWWRRAGYCAFFGGLGYGFGGSISYMVPMGYASSGVWSSTWFGFCAVFLIGGLWAGMGGAGIALPLSMDRDRLTRLFTPLAFVLVTMYLGKRWEAELARWLATATHDSKYRHEGPLYWFDADCYEATLAILGVCLYDLWDRRFGRVLELGAFSAVGAIGGYLVQFALNSLGLSKRIWTLLVVPQGDPTAINPETNAPFDSSLFIANWPTLILDNPERIGIATGLLVGLGVYFYRNGKWNNDAGLFLSMAFGFWIVFLAMPVLLTIPFKSYGGFRLTPPRGENWAGMIGVFAGTCVYTYRNGLAPVTFAATSNFILGGIAFPTALFLRNFAKIPGQATFPIDPEVIKSWSHYQSANWHSVLEQSQGFCLGLITALTMASLWRRLKVVSDDPPIRCWTDVAAIGFVVFGMTWQNYQHVARELVHSGLKIVPEIMKAPFFSWIQLSGETWFGLAWWCIASVFILLMIFHQRHPIAIVPASWAGRAQLIYILVLWIMVIGNVQLALAHNFGEGRLVTEWVIIINASLATFLMLVLPRSCGPVQLEESTNYSRLIARTWTIGLIVGVSLMFGYAFTTLEVFKTANLNPRDLRWGEKANWRVRPLLKNVPHR